jgi:deazaflavin-dependent oxidoreductase (nitroreductase family)
VIEDDDVAGRYGRRVASLLLGRGVRYLARAPIGLYRAGYGFLLGHRVLMLEHTGRKTGLPRYVVLEVVRRLSEDTFVVAAGMGPKADWYRNIERQPHVRVWVARGTAAVAVAQPIEQAEARRHFEAYRAERPWTWRLLRPVISRLIGRPGQTDEDLFATVPLVELRLVGTS